MRRRMGAEYRPPCNPPKIRLGSVTFGDLLKDFSNCGEEKGGGGTGGEGAGARRDSLALRCPVITAQPDGPGSGRKLRAGDLTCRSLLSEALQREGVGVSITQHWLKTIFQF